MALGDVLGDTEGPSIQLLRLVPTPDHLQLGAVTVVLKTEMLACAVIVERFPVIFVSLVFNC